MRESDLYHVVLRSVLRLKHDLEACGGVARRIKVDVAVAEAIARHFMEIQPTDFTHARFMGLEIEVVDKPEYLEVLP